MLNRTLLYLTRKKGKSLILFILIFLISTFVTTSLALMYTTNQVSTFIRESVDARIEIREIRQQIMMNEEDLEDVSELPLITEANIDQIMVIDGLEQYNTINTGVASAQDIDFRKGMYADETDNMGRIQGVNDSSLLSDFMGDSLSLVGGRHITGEDENVLMISETLARENNIEIGDILNLQPAQFTVDEEGIAKNELDDTTIYIQVEIIGIFAITENQINADLMPSAHIATNQMFADHHLMNGLGLTEIGQYETITLFVQDPRELPRIVQETRQLDDMDWDYFLMTHDDGDYMKISGDLQTAQNLLIILLVAIGVVSAIILTLILILRMRGRVHEVGILLSVGINKKQIIGGLLLEIMMIAMLSFMISYALGRIVVPTLNQSLLANLPAIADLEEHQFQTLSLATSAHVYLMILLIILITAYISTLMTIRLKPKQILSKMS